MSEANTLGTGEVIEPATEPVNILNTKAGKRLFARILFGFVSLMVVRFLILIYLAFNVMGILQTIKSGRITDEMAVTGKLTIMAGLHLIANIFGVFLVILFFVWLYLSVKTRNEINPQTQRFPPTWAVLGFIIPIVNIFMPVLIMIDLWAGSTRQIAGEPKRIMIHGIVFAVIWWVFYVLEGSLNVMNVAMQLNIHLPAADLTALVSRLGLAALIGVVHGVCLLLFVAGIEKQQQDSADSMAG